MSSSFVPNTTESTTPTAAAAMATARADQKESIWKPELNRSTRSNIPASTNSTRKKPSSAVNGNRNAATTGGRSAFSTAMTAAATMAEPSVESDAPGTSFVAMSSETAASSQPSSSCPARKRGFSGDQPGASPYV